MTSQLRELQETTATDLRQQVGEPAAKLHRIATTFVLRPLLHSSFTPRLKTRCENAVEKVQTEWKDHLTGQGQGRRCSGQASGRLVTRTGEEFQAVQS